MLTLRCARVWGELALVLALSAGSLCACESEPDEVRPWRPEDHQPPPAVADEGRAAPPAAGGATDEGRVVAALWTARCARCHGSEGRGGGPDAPPGAPVPDFSSPSWQAQRSDAQLAQAVLQGRGMMPAFEDQLGTREVALLVRHVRSFAPSDGQPAQAPEGESPQAPAAEPPGGGEAQPEASGPGSPPSTGAPTTGDAAEPAPGEPPSADSP